MKIFQGNMRLSCSGSDGTTTAAVGIHKVVTALGQVLQIVHINMPQHNMWYQMVNKPQQVAGVV